MENSMPLKHIAADIDALMASDAAERLENLITGQLFRRDRVGLAYQPSVEAAARCDERSLVCRDRIQYGGIVGLVFIGFAELFCHLGVGAQLIHGLFEARRHDRWIAEAALDSLLQRSDIPFPIQAKVQTCIEDRRRVERHGLPFRSVVGIGTGAVGSYIVARKTTVCIIVRQTTIAEQSLPERQTLWVLGTRGGNGGNRLLARTGLADWRLSCDGRYGVKANDSQR